MLVAVVATGKVWKLGDDLTTWTEFSTGSAAASSVAWADVTGKPTTFAPSAHTHTSADITDFASAVVAAAPPTVDASLLTQGTLSASRLPASVVLTNDGRLADAREWSADTISQAEAEAGTATTRRAYTALRVFQAVAAWWAASAAKAKLDGVSAGATANATDAQLRDRSTHTGTQPASTITGLATVATSGSYSDLSNKPMSFAPTAHAAAHTANGTDPLTLTSAQILDFATAAAAAAPATTNASLLTSGTLPDARLSSTVTAALTNARTPTSHAASHATGGSDAISPASIGAVATNDTRLVSDGNKGDLTVSSNGSTWTINAGAVTEADLANAVRNQIFHPFLLMGG